MSTPGTLTPDCPLCGQPPYMVMGGGTQAFCFFLRNVKRVQIENHEGPGDGGHAET